MRDVVRPRWQLERAQVNFGARLALAPLTLQILPGESVALVGANGSGKSTLLRLLHGVLQPTAGRLLASAGSTQAMLFQRPFMLRTTACNNVALALFLKGHGWGQAKALAEHALVRVGLQAQAAQPARTLSGGQQQKLALARAWALQPQMLLLDEPTASLDPHAKREVEQLMADFMADGRSEPLTMVFASHNLGQVKRLATRVIYLEQGRVLADLPVAEFFDVDTLRAASPAAHQFVKGERI
jgi:tungstate transport system ATP-binding protein